ncbi:MAG: FAD-dependent oxidoreductase [Gemmataceae bacterium]|nr:FAD-dependent oxidoreductase [Gemmataceae bacterium]
MQSIEGQGYRAVERIVIAGGGLAGLACASDLAKAGLKVTLLESKGGIGGRATSFHDPLHGDLIDHCQHVSMGCCKELAQFCLEADISHYLKSDGNLHFVTPGGEVSQFHGNPLPAPLHLASSFLKAKFLTLREKARIGIGLGLMRLAKEGEDGLVLEWLKDHFQTERTLERFWAPVIVSALNTPMQRAGFHYARKVFVDSFFQSRHSYELTLPTVPLGKLYGEEIIQWLEGAGVETLLGTAASQILFQGGQVAGVRLASGEEIPTRTVVLAVPFQRVPDLVPPEERLGDFWHWIDRLSLSPITSVHLWFDRKITGLDHAALLDGQSQWLFYRGCNTRGEHYYQVVISASGEMLQGGNQKALETVLRELPGWFPAVGEAGLIRSRVISEKQATFESTAWVDQIRPGQATPISGLFLAGDYTQTGWPATMEGAVRSGKLAADCVLKTRTR